VAVVDRARKMTSMTYLGDYNKHNTNDDLVGIHRFLMFSHTSFNDELVSWLINNS
jgi:hypothetical protein